MLSFAILILTGITPQFFVVPQANAAIRDYFNNSEPPPVPEINEIPLKGSAQDVVYPAIKKSDSQFYFEAALSAFNIWFYDREEQKAMTRIGPNDQHYFEYYLPKKNVPLAFTEEGYSYQVSEDVELNYSLKFDSLKEDIVLNRMPASGDFRFEYQKKGVFFTEVGGEYYFFSEDSMEQLFKFQKPTIVDAKGRTGDISLKINDNQIILEPNELFLRNADYPVTIDPVVVGNSTSTGAVGQSKDRPMVRTGRGIMVVVWYQNSTNYLVGSRSLDDGQTWLQLNADSSGSTAIGGDVNSQSNFSLNVDDDNYVNVAYAKSNGTYISSYWRELQFNGANNQYTVGSESAVFVGSATFSAHFPYVTETENNNIYVAIDNESRSDHVGVRVSTNNGGAWSTLAGSAPANADDPVVLTIDGSNDLQYFYCYTSSNYLYRNYYNGTTSAWAGVAAVADIGAQYDYSVAVGSAVINDLHLVYTNAGAIYYKRYNGTAWGNDATLASSGGASATITYAGGDLYVFATITTGQADQVAYKKKTGASWDSSWTYVSEITNKMDYVYAYDDSAATYTNETADAGDYGAADVPFFEDLATAANDYLYIGGASPFYNVNFFLSTKAGANASPDWEYYSSVAGDWSDIVTEVDGTAGFTQDGGVDWMSGNVPSWTNNTVNGINAYWIRAKAESIVDVISPVGSYIIPFQNVTKPRSPDRIIEGTTHEFVSQSGFGDSNNDYIFALEVFDDYLYAGTSKPSSTGGELWRSNDGLSWNQVSSDGFGDNANIYLTDMEVAGEYLYIGTKNSSGAEVWRSTNGTGFSQVNDNGFGDSNNLVVEQLIVFNDYLYASTYNNTSGTEVWRCDITNCDAQGDWAQVNSDGFGDSINNSGPNLINVYVNGESTRYLYSATRRSNTSGSEIFRCSEASGCDAAGDWSAVIENANGGFGDANNILIRASEVFNDYLYYGTRNDTTGTEVWRCALSSNCDAIGDFSQVNSDGFGSANITNTTSLKSYYGQYLYSGTQNSTNGASLLQCTLSSGCDSNSDWSILNSAGFGSVRLSAIESMQVFRDYMYMGVDNTINGPIVIRNFYDRSMVFWGSGSASPYDAKYDEARYRPMQENFRWYDDQTSEAPSTAFAAENSNATSVHKENAIRLRVTLRDDGHHPGTDIRMKLQYSTDNSQFFDVAPSDETYAPWRYFDGGGTDDSNVATQVLTDSDAKGPHVEELERVSTYDQGANTWAEFDFSIENYNAPANGTYYFRAVWSESGEPVVKSSGKTSPAATTATSYTLSLTGPSGVTLPNYTLGNASGNVSYTFNSVEGEEITMQDYTGSGDGWSVTALSTDLTETHSWSNSGTQGFGDSNNTSVKSLAVDTSREYLFAGTINSSTGGEIWRYNGTSWDQINNDGFDNSNNTGISRLVTQGEYLYASTRNETNGAQLWRCYSSECDSQSNWSQATDSGFGDANNYDITSLIYTPNGGNVLVAGTEKNNPGINDGAELWKCYISTNCDEQADWSQINNDGFGDNDNQSIVSLVDFSAYLYVGTLRSNSSAAELWRCFESVEPPCESNSDFSVITDTGFGNSNNTGFSAMAEFATDLYVFTKNSTNGTQAWRCDPEVSACSSVVAFTQVNQNGYGGGNGLPDTLYANVWDSDYDYLYVSTNQRIETTCNVYWTEDGTNWNLANPSGFTSDFNQCEGIDVFGQNIYVGLGETTPGSGAWLKTSANADIIWSNDISWSTGTITPVLGANITGMAAGAGGAMDPVSSVSVVVANDSGCTPDPPGCGAGAYTILPTLVVGDLNNEDNGDYSATMTLTIQ